MDVLLIGHGAVAREVLRRLEPDEPARVRGVLVRPNRVDAVRAELPRSIEVVGFLDDLSFEPDICAECAGHEAVAQYGPAVLENGVDLIVISIGALADRVLFEELVEAAADGDARLILPAGAVAGADALAAARVGGLTSVRYVSRKPPLAWKGTPAEEEFDLDALSGETVLFQGAADEAARLYPQNANVAATIALAGAGFDETEVMLIADPAAGGNIHQVHAQGMFGEFDIEVRGKPLPDNPKTSTLAAHSVVHAIRNAAGVVVF